MISLSASILKRINKIARRLLIFFLVVLSITIILSPFIYSTGLYIYMKYEPKELLIGRDTAISFANGYFQIIHLAADSYCFAVKNESVLRNIQMYKMKDEHLLIVAQDGYCIANIETKNTKLFSHPSEMPEDIRVLFEETSEFITLKERDFSRSSNNEQ